MNFVLKSVPYDVIYFVTLLTVTNDCGLDKYFIVKS